MNFTVECRQLTMNSATSCSGTITIYPQEMPDGLMFPHITLEIPIVVRDESVSAIQQELLQQARLLLDVKALENWVNLQAQKLTTPQP